MTDDVFQCYCLFVFFSFFLRCLQSYTFNLYFVRFLASYFCSGSFMSFLSRVLTKSFIKGIFIYLLANSFFFFFFYEELKMKWRYFSDYRQKRCTKIILDTWQSFLHFLKL